MWPVPTDYLFRPGVLSTRADPLSWRRRQVNTGFGDGATLLLILFTQSAQPKKTHTFRLYYRNAAFVEIALSRVRIIRIILCFQEANSLFSN